MGKTSTVSARIDPDTKRQAERIFSKLGLTASQAITLFYEKVALQRGLPFAVKLPNDTTGKALEEAQDRDKLPRFDTTEALFEESLSLRR